MEHDSEAQVRHITVGLILSWIVGLIVIVASLGFMVSGPVSGVIVLIGGLIMLPPVGDFIRRKTHVRLSGGVRFLIAIILFAIGVGMAAGAAVGSAQQRAADISSVASTTASIPATSNDRLELLSYTCSVEYGYFKISGQVKNISDKPMENIMAVGSLYTDSGEFVKSSDAVISYNPILAGQTSPFETLTTTNPEATKCQVEFKEMFGGTIPTKVPAKS